MLEITTLASLDFALVIDRTTWIEWTAYVRSRATLPSEREVLDDLVSALQPGNPVTFSPGPITPPMSTVDDDEAIEFIDLDEAGPLREPFHYKLRLPLVSKLPMTESLGEQPKMSSYPTSDVFGHGYENKQLPSPPEEPERRSSMSCSSQWAGASEDNLAPPPLKMRHSLGAIVAMLRGTNIPQSEEEPSSLERRSSAPSLWNSSWYENVAPPPPPPTTTTNCCGAGFGENVNMCSSSLTRSFAQRPYYHHRSSSSRKFGDVVPANRAGIVV
jgi:hypothetical protein